MRIVEGTVPLSFQELTALVAFVGATFGAVLKGREIYEKFKPKKKARKRKPRARKKPPPDQVIPNPSP